MRTKTASTVTITAAVTVGSGFGWFGVNSIFNIVKIILRLWDYNLSYKFDNAYVKVQTFICVFSLTEEK